MRATPSACSKPTVCTAIVLITGATDMWRSVHEFTAAGIEVVPAPVGMVLYLTRIISEYVPSADALARAHAAINELLGEQVRLFLAATHLRRH